MERHTGSQKWGTYKFTVLAANSVGLALAANPEKRSTLFAYEEIGVESLGEAKKGSYIASFFLACL